MSKELINQLALELVPGVGPKGAKQLVSYCGSASQVFDSSVNQLLKIPGVGSGIASSIKSSNTFREAEFILQSAERIGAKIIHYSDKLYPKKLRQIHDAPNLLYLKGQGDLNPKRTVAVVGARKATNYGKSITDRIVSELAAIDTTVISGLAFGIDIQAHRSALMNNVPTFGVVAGGIDRIYPSLHKKYAEEMMEMGGIISESIPGTKPDKHLFPIRNRIIAGLSDATIVVEAAERGGALITANLADSYNRTVFAVPGDVGNKLSVGANNLIASQKALIYTGIENLIYHLGWKLKSNKSEDIIPNLSDEEEVVYFLLKEINQPIEIDILAYKSKLPINTLSSTLLGLEFKNLVKNLPGKKFIIQN